MTRVQYFTQYMTGTFLINTPETLQNKPRPLVHVHEQVKCGKSSKSVSVTYLPTGMSRRVVRQAREAGLHLASYYRACVPLFNFFPRWIPKLHNRWNFDPHNAFSFIHHLAGSFKKVHATMHQRHPRIVGLLTGLENYLAYDSISYQLTYIRYVAELNRDVLLATLHPHIHNATAVQYKRPRG